MPRVVDKSPTPRRQGVLNRGPFANQQALSVAPAGMANPQAAPQLAMPVSQFEQQYLSGASIGAQGAAQFDQYRQGNTPAYALTSPAARRAAYQHFEQHGNPAVAARQQAINQDVQRRLATPDPQTGLTPQQALEAGSGQGRPFTAEQMATKQALREQHAARTRETQAKLAERKQKQAQARAERRGVNLLSPREFELADQMRQQAMEHLNRQEAAKTNMAVVDVYKKRGFLPEGLDDYLANVAADPNMTPNHMRLLLESVRYERRKTDDMPSFNELFYILPIPERPTNPGTNEPDPDAEPGEFGFWGEQTDEQFDRWTKAAMNRRQRLQMLNEMLRGGGGQHRPRPGDESMPPMEYGLYPDGLPTVKSDEDYDRLPVGTIFVDEEGNVYRKEK